MQHDRVHRISFGLRALVFVLFLALLGGCTAGGWKGFFLTLPVSFSWVDMDTTDVEGGAIISASPRAGYLFKMGNYGNLGLFVGASYLDSDLTAHGSLAVLTVPLPSILSQ